MELIIICVLFYLVCSWLGSSNGNSSSYNNNYYKKNYYKSNTLSSGRNTFKSNGNKSGEEFEEAGSFYDREGNEHIIDDDNYCEDCDDYHDNY